MFVQPMTSVMLYYNISLDSRGQQRDFGRTAVVGAETLMKPQY